MNDCPEPGHGHGCSFGNDVKQISGHLWGNLLVPLIKSHLGASLVAQCSRSCLPMQETWIRSLVWEDPTCLRAAKAMWLCSRAWELQPRSPRAATAEACTPLTPCATAGEATALRTLHTATREQPPLPATKEKPTQQPRPSTAQPNK